jgi:glucuronoarabinoxylan endo-1,4-beta-xylanase
MIRRAFAVLALGLLGCTPSPGPQTGSQTNWLFSCDSAEQCGALECICGACTAPCASSDSACGDLPGASCIASIEQGAIALCGGQAPPSGLCLPRCDDSRPCADGTSCVAGVCTPTANATVRVTVDTTARHQTLVGFGASLAYADEQIVAHPQKEALYDFLFGESGLDVLRLRNRYQDGAGDPLASTIDVVQGMSERQGHTPLTFMTSGTPPAALKANGSRPCAGDEVTCTLVTLPGGGFDYAGFASWWRSSLEAYETAGVTPDYISIQNNPNWVPPAEAPLDACRFLPEEGMTTLTVDGAPVDVTYPGYREALEAVRSAIADLPTVPRIGAPETGVVGVSEYAPPLDASASDAIAFHVYGLDPAAVDVAALETVRALAEQQQVRLFQTEMQAEGLDTAILVHHTLTSADASVYLQNNLVSVTSAEDPVALASLTANAFEPQGPYYALSQYAKNTDPGWMRVDAASDSTTLLSSAWLSPGEDALTVVLVNPGTEELDAEVVVPAEFRSQLVRSEVTRTVFEGVERSAALGERSANGVVRVPSRSILTIAFTSN